MPGLLKAAAWMTIAATIPALVAADDLLTEPAAGLAQLGVASILGWAVWYLLAKHLPRERQVWTDTNTKQREAYLIADKQREERYQAMAKEQRENSNLLREAVKNMASQVQQCSQVIEKRRDEKQ